MLGSATIMDDMATVIISSLKCEGTYSITAGGTFDHTLEGSRFHRETVTTGECPEMSSTSELWRLHVAGDQVTTGSGIFSAFFNVSVTCFRLPVFTGFSLLTGP